jgi:hypothetical protein
VICQEGNFRDDRTRKNRILSTEAGVRRCESSNHIEGRNISFRPSSDPVTRTGVESEARCDPLSISPAGEDDLGANSRWSLRERGLKRAFWRTILNLRTPRSPIPDHETLQRFCTLE